MISASKRLSYKFNVDQTYPVVFSSHDDDGQCLVLVWPLLAQPAWSDRKLLSDAKSGSDRYEYALFSLFFALFEIIVSLKITKTSYKGLSLV